MILDMKLGPCRVETDSSIAVEFTPVWCKQCHKSNKHHISKLTVQKRSATQNSSSGITPTSWLRLLTSTSTGRDDSKYSSQDRGKCHPPGAVVAPSSKWKDVYLCQWHDHPGGVAFASYWLNVLHDSRSFCKKWSEVRAPARQSSTRVYNHQQTLHACNITLAKPVAGFNNTIRVLESTSNNWLSRTQVTTLILLFQPQGRPDTVLAASQWQDRPPGILVQHRYAAVILFFRVPPWSENWTVDGDHRMAEGHESRREAPSGGGVWGDGVPLPREGCPGVSPPGKFWNLRRNLVKSGAFWQEIDVFPVFHLRERKHCHSDRQWYWHSGLLF